MNLATPAATKVVGALALLLIAAAGWMLVIGPQNDALAEVREQTQTARDQNDLLTLQLATLRKQAAELDATRETAAALARKFPPTADQPGLFRQVTGAATAAGIPARDVTALTPTPPTVGGVDPAAGVQPESGPAQLARQTVTVSVTGGYTETQDLLENLEEMPRAYLVSSVTLSSASEGGSAEAGGPGAGAFTTTITGDMFVMPPAVDPGPQLDLTSSP